jgi:hypothetical protein
MDLRKGNKVAVEEHPQFAEWSEALDQLVAVSKEFSDAMKTGRKGPALQPFLIRLKAAQAHYDEVIDRINWEQLGS